MNFLMLWIICFAGPLFLLFSTVTLFSINKILKFPEENKTKIYDYQFLQYSTSLNETQLGFVSFPQKLDLNEYISFQDYNNGNHFLISNSDTIEYSCTGSCNCEEGRKRRSASAVISKGILFYLIAATTTLVAYQKAREYFEDQCKADLRDSCGTDSIKSQVDICVEMSGREDRKRRPFIEFTNLDENWEVIGRYYCHGRCLSQSMNRKKASTEEKDLEEEKKIDCKKLEVSAEVLFRMSNIRKVEIPGITHDLHPVNHKAQEQFQRENLDPFCKSGSISDVDGKSLCCAVPKHSDFVINPSVDCKQRFFLTQRMEEEEKE